MSDPDEENKSCHSSSSDTLTCSLPQVNASLDMVPLVGLLVYPLSPVLCG